LNEGLPRIAREMDFERGDVEEIEGRKVTAIDDGYLSDVHAASRNDNSKLKFKILKFERRPLAPNPAKVGHPVRLCRAGINHA